MGHELTNEELEQLDILMGTLRVDTHLEEPVWRSGPLLRKSAKELPLEHEAASESFLVAELEGRCVLSPETRRAEEQRLARRARPRKRYARRGRFHHKSKEATKRKRNLKAWKDDPLTRIRHSFRQGVDITDEEWQRLIEPVWRRYPTETLRVRVAGGRGGPLTAYNILVEHGRASGPKQVVYNGPNQAILDVQDSKYSGRVMELRSPRKG